MPMNPDANLAARDGHTMAVRGSNHAGMRQFNERIVLQAIRLHGATAKADTFGPEAYTRLDGWLQTPHHSSPQALLAVAVGFLIAMFLQVMRTRFPWWPFHPLGFAVTSSWEINLVWLPLFIAWVLKLAILRYGGRQGFSKSIPFFLGLILGQFVVGSLWNLYGIAAQVPTYQFLE